MCENPDSNPHDDPFDGTKANTVKKVIILADVHNIPENYHNVLTLWNQCGLNDLKLICACDHKMANIICGIQVSFIKKATQEFNINMN